MTGFITFFQFSSFLQLNKNSFNNIAFSWAKYSTRGVGIKVAQRGAGVYFGDMLHILCKNSEQTGRYNTKL